MLQNTKPIMIKRDGQGRDISSLLLLGTRQTPTEQRDSGAGPGAEETLWCCQARGPNSHREHRGAGQTPRPTHKLTCGVARASQSPVTLFKVWAGCGFWKTVPQ